MMITLSYSQFSAKYHKRLEVIKQKLDHNEEKL